MTDHRPDLDSRTEIHDLVVAFYRGVVFDDLLAPMFGEVAEVDWTTHIPHLTNFWCRVLLGDPAYDGNILGAHRHVHSLEPFRQAHFDRWYTMFCDTVDAGWSGPMATRAKAHAARVADMLARQLDVSWRAPVDVADHESNLAHRGTLRISAKGDAHPGH